MTTTRKFLINGDPDTPQPETDPRTERVTVGKYLSGEPINQGYPSTDLTWSKIFETDLAKLLSFYDPNDHAVTLQFFDAATAADVTRSAMMEEPRIGTHHYGHFDSVSVRFSHLEPLPS